MATFTTTMAVRVKKEDHDLICAEAEKQGKSPTALITRWVERNLERLRTSKKGEPT